MEFGAEHCSQVLGYVLSAMAEIRKTPGAKLYVIYYEGKLVSSIWNNKLIRYDYKYSNPKRGEALRRAKEVRLTVKDVKFSNGAKFSEGDVILLSGGFREEFVIELWSVAENAEPPRPTPTLQENDIKFSKGKPFKPRLCARIYDGL
ncbi:MAG TPA: hypothetical protein VK400_12465 [Pyrinomonadaceae bacterium]|nr:hypothetical protein [Pyrinomonadaceae bacterium]